jgi:hypothetical protein
MEISNVWKWGIFVEIISEKEEDWWPLAFDKKSSGAMVGRRDSSTQPLDNAEVTKKGVNLGTFDEKPTHFLMETHVYLYLQIYWLWTMSWRLLFKKIGKPRKGLVLCPLSFFGMNLNGMVPKNKVRCFLWMKAANPNSALWLNYRRCGVSRVPKKLFFGLFCRFAGYC